MTWMIAHACRRLGYGLGCWAAMAAPWIAEAASGEPPALSRSVPADARLFLGVRDTAELLRTPVGATLAGAIAGLTHAEAPPADTQPASAPSGLSPADRGALHWPRWFGRAVGLPTARAAELLLDGEVALAARGWSGLGEAVLLARPTDCAGFERELSAAIQPIDDARPRRYSLSDDHELVCDGTVASVGLTKGPLGLYEQTVRLMAGEGGAALGDLAEFRNRVSSLPEGTQIVLYGGSDGRGASGALFWPGWWPASWPRLQSAAVGVSVGAEAVRIECSGRLAPGSPRWGSAAAPVHVLSHVPASTLAAWTQAIDYVQHFRHLTRGSDQAGLYDSLLQAGLGPQAIEETLLVHLVGDSILILGRTRARTAATAGADGEPALLLPTLTLAVETDDPYAVELAMLHLAENLILLLNQASELDVPIQIRDESVGGGGVISSVPLSRLFPARIACVFLGSLEISWTVADRWLIVGTHAGAVREVVQAWRGGSEVMPADLVTEVMRQVRISRGSAEKVLIAQPRWAAEMIDSWMAYLRREHPEVLQADWWRRLRQKQQAREVQLGILPRRVGPGEIEVESTGPGWPAHGRLLPGDRIRGVGGEPLSTALDTEQTLETFRSMVALRKSPERLTLMVIREGREMDVEVPMPVSPSSDPSLPPIQFLRRVADLLRLFDSASYAAWHQPPDVLKARFELKMTGSGRP
jgi:hypothetical protein